jgi:hypothetical protein
MVLVANVTESISLLIGLVCASLRFGKKLPANDFTSTDGYQMALFLFLSSTDQNRSRS